MATYSQLHVDCTDVGTTWEQFILKQKQNQQPKFCILTERHHKLHSRMKQHLQKLGGVVNGCGG